MKSNKLNKLSVLLVHFLVDIIVSRLLRFRVLCKAILFKQFYMGFHSFYFFYTYIDLLDH